MSRCVRCSTGSTPTAARTGRRGVTELPGVNTQIERPLDSPHVREFTVGCQPPARRPRRRARRRRPPHLPRLLRGPHRHDDRHCHAMTSDETFDLTLVENTNAVKREYTALNLQASYRLERGIRCRRQLHALEALRQRQRREHPQRTADVLDSAAAGVLRSGVEFPEGSLAGRSTAPRAALGNVDLPASRTSHWPALARHARADPLRDAVRRGRHHPHPAVRGQSRLPSSRRIRSTTFSPSATRSARRP